MALISDVRFDIKLERMSVILCSVCDSVSVNKYSTYICLYKYSKIIVILSLKIGLKNNLN